MSQDLEMRMRIAQKIENLLKTEAQAAQFDALEGAHILGLVLGLGAASAPTEAARAAFFEAHTRGVGQGTQLRNALDQMSGEPS